MTKTSRSVSQLIHLQHCKLLEPPDAVPCGGTGGSQGTQGARTQPGWGPAACGGQAGHIPAPQPARTAGSGQAPTRHVTAAHMPSSPAGACLPPRPATVAASLRLAFPRCSHSPAASPAPHTDPHRRHRHTALPSAIFTEGKQTPLPAEVLGEQRPCWTRASSAEAAGKQPPS